MANYNKRDADFCPDLGQDSVGYTRSDFGEIDLTAKIPRRLNAILISCLLVFSIIFLIGTLAFGFYLVYISLR